MKLEAPAEPLVKPNVAPKEIFPPAVMMREGVALRVELFVKLPLKVVVPEDVVLREFAELLVMAAPKVTP